MRFEYLVVPFIGTAKKSWLGDQGPAHVGMDLQNLLNYHAQEGWEYMRVETIMIHRHAGCLVSIILNKGSDSFEFHQIIFRRPVAAS